MHFSSTPLASLPTKKKKVLKALLHFSRYSLWVLRGWGRGLGERVWEGGRGHRPRLGILSSRGVPGLPTAGEPRRQGSPHSLPPSLPQQDRPAGIPIRAVIAPTRREMPTFRSLQNQAVGSCPEKRDEARGLDTLPAPGPCTFPSSLLSPGLSRRDGPPCRAPHRPTVAVPGPATRPPLSPWLAPALVAVEFPQPIAPPAREAALGSWQPQILGAETEAEGGAPGARGRRGECGARDARGPPPPAADPGIPGQGQTGRGRAETAGHPSPLPHLAPPAQLCSRVLDPTRPHQTPPDPPVTSATAAPANPQPSEISLAEHWSSLRGGGSLKRVWGPRGVADAGWRVSQGGRGCPPARPPHPLCLFFFPHFPSPLQDVGVGGGGSGREHLF